MLLFDDNSTSYVGVFDGLGGAGAKRYDTVAGPQSGARIAAFECSSMYQRWVQDNGNAFDLSALGVRFRVGLSEVAGRYPMSDSLIKSKMIRDFPSTMAVSKLSAIEEGRAEITCGWAGDSRIYALSPAEGLTQISTDHIKNRVDAQQNLLLDAPLSNFLHAGGAFKVEWCRFTQTLPLALIVATDGCFGYLPSPLHFEQIILDAVTNSKSLTECKEALSKSIENTTSDDASMVVVFCGWNNWVEVGQSFAKRLTKIQRLSQSFRDADKAVATFTQLLEEATVHRVDELNDLWRSYRISYESTLRTSIVEVKE
ncbi:hypothetical protein [Mycolicibacterium cosmeticum]|uniref:hypothetical protein n=1 Tax=Mycolicibacterium cosmeticum TaxID=258533 RepID=UPI003204A611